MCRLPRSSRRPQVAVGEDPGQALRAVDDQRRARPPGGLGHGHDHVDHARPERHQRQLGARAHDLGHLHQLAPQRAGGMEARELLAPEAALGQHHHRQRVAQRHHGRGRGRGREPERAGLVHAPDVEHAVGELGDRGFALAGQRQDRGADAAHVGQQRLQLLGLARVREHEQDVVRADAPEIAVHGLGGVQRDRGRAGRRERGRELGAHQAGLAHAGDDHHPLQARMRSTASSKRPSRRSMSPAIVCASSRITSAARASRSPLFALAIASRVLE
jgi:hypothetical protein